MQAKRNTRHRMTACTFGITPSTFILQQQACKDGQDSSCNCGSWMNTDAQYCLVTASLIFRLIQVNFRLSARKTCLRDLLILHSIFSSGYHELEIRCWRASGSITDELNSFFLGTSASLADEKIIFGKAWEARSQLNTVSSGTGSARQLAVYAALSVIFN